jgi:hypothetical protein
LADKLASNAITVRDFGYGLDKADTKRLLFGFGASGDLKRSSNQMIGGFGVGCKCGFAVTDAFLYTVYHNGTCCVWNCYLDDDDAPCATLLSEGPTTEPSGILVSIPLSQTEGNSITWNSVQKLYEHLDAGVTVTRGDETRTITAPTESVTVVSSMDIEIDGVKSRIKYEVLEAPSPAGLECVLGGFAFPLDKTQLPEVEFSEFTKRIRAYLPIGFVPLAPNRESIKYTKRTVKILDAMMNELVARSIDKLVENAGALSIVQRSRLNTEFPARFQQQTNVLPALGSGLSFKFGKVETVHSWQHHEVDLAARISWTEIDPWPAKATGPLYVGSGTVPKVAVILLPGNTGSAKASWMIRKAVFDAMDSNLLEPPANKLDDWEIATTIIRGASVLLDGVVKDLDSKTDTSILVLRPAVVNESRSSDIRPMGPTKINVKLGEFHAQGYSHSQYVTQYASAPGTKFVRRNTKDIINKPCSGGWDKVPIKDVKAFTVPVYVAIDRYLVGQGCYSTDTIRDLSLNSPNLFPDGILGVRRSELRKVEEHPDYTQVCDYLCAKFKELAADPNSPVSIERLAWFLSLSKLAVRGSNAGGNAHGTRILETYREFATSITSRARALQGTPALALSRELLKWQSEVADMEGMELEIYTAYSYFHSTHIDGAIRKASEFDVGSDTSPAAMHVAGTNVTDRSNRSDDKARWTNSVAGLRDDRQFRTVLHDWSSKLQKEYPLIAPYLVQGLMMKDHDASNKDRHSGDAWTWEPNVVDMKEIVRYINTVINK